MEATHVLRELHEVGYAVVPGLHALRERPMEHPSLPALDALVAAYLGPETHLVTSGWRAPEQGRGQQGLHHDFLPRAVDQPPTVLTCLLFLDDFGPANGATGVLPGSHRWPTPLPKSQQQPQATHPDERQAEGQAGDTLLFDGHLWHRGRENLAGTPRRALQLQFAVGASPPLAAERS
jgi:ectoine hydroxylase-related dioxygenase (phytanoyl-CoA dioxygenase family)